jgi:Na+-driven multidrug efflux pump
MLINIIASTVDIGLNYLLISKVGLNGAAVATVTSETIASIIAFSYTIWFIYVKKQE